MAVLGLTAAQQLRFTLTQPSRTLIKATKSLSSINHGLRRFERMGTRIDDDYNRIE